MKADPVADGVVADATKKYEGNRSTRHAQFARDGGLQTVTNLPGFPFAKVLKIIDRSLSFWWSTHMMHPQRKFTFASTTRAIRVGHAIVFMSLLIGMLALMTTTGSTHTLPWRAGELRQKCVGHCARGACLIRADWSPSRPHTHAGKQVVFGRLPPVCRSVHIGMLER